MRKRFKIELFKQWSELIKTTLSRTYKPFREYNDDFVKNGMLNYCLVVLKNSYARQINKQTNKRTTIHFYRY